MEEANQNQVVLTFRKFAGNGKFLTDGIVDSPGLPNRTATQSTFYQLNTTTTPD